ncbi:hypothetical protein BCV72DRAFT_304060 [Rhizopus microsporus var. microsporus]|uniref:Uncharacterized protein n=2 Tax=Rhizopus microsporus TaxID=58291 RepID=A0A2G4SUZ4_RHIZD|nr:uncharacterized protein RHIMIDRAFT_134252 [Rhizopus microsporus ATCC 52813]ORE08036.1 hypothetical protein BCV72DRAFT_304060 [Rhizopus microsporus var. microsporus]PHZ12585.1 hypothetical protein RHIMIDRAFT_134252 [Rhizopus microsporus ATCC 52813]
MAKQLKILELHKEENHSYLADGIVKLYGPKDLEVLLLETSSSFASIDRAKYLFDHHKGFFGTLSMLKLTADKFHKASIETFCKSKVLFVHAAGENIYFQTQITVSLN